MEEEKNEIKPEETQENSQTSVTSTIVTPSVILVGATGSGKSTQVCQMMMAEKSVFSAVKILLFDPGSRNAYRRVMSNVMRWTVGDPIKMIDGTIKQLKPGELLVIDNWPGFESASVQNFKRVRNTQKMTLPMWGQLVPTWIDAAYRIANADNVVLLGNISDGTSKIKTPEGTVLMPPGSMVCTPALREKQPMSATFPVVLGLSRGNAKGTIPRGYVSPRYGRVGEINVKYEGREVDGRKSWMLPGEVEDDKVVPFERCNLGLIMDSLSF